MRLVLQWRAKYIATVSYEYCYLILTLNLNWKLFKRLVLLSIGRAIDFPTLIFLDAWNIDAKLTQKAETNSYVTDRTFSSWTSGKVQTTQRNHAGRWLRVIQNTKKWNLLMATRRKGRREQSLPWTSWNHFGLSKTKRVMYASPAGKLTTLMNVRKCATSKRKCISSSTKCNVRLSGPEFALSPVSGVPHELFSLRLILCPASWKRILARHFALLFFFFFFPYFFLQKLTIKLHRRRKSTERRLLRSWITIASKKHR